MVAVEWLGHSCFLVTGTHVRIIIDPFEADSRFRYPPVTAAADLVLVTHEHFDHNNSDAVGGSPSVMRGPGEWKSPIHIRGLEASHGPKRGKTAIYVFQVDGLNFCHLGDLGEIPSAELARQIGSVDVLMIPVGGVYTIDHSGADEVLRILKPRLVLPMHYKTESVGLPLDPVSKFTRGKTNVRAENSSTISIDKDNLPASTTIVVLAPPAPKR